MAKLPPPQKEIGWYDDDDEWEDPSIFTTQLPGPVPAVEQQENPLIDKMNVVVVAAPQSNDASFQNRGTSDGGGQDAASSVLCSNTAKADHGDLTSKTPSTPISLAGPVTGEKAVIHALTKNARVSETGKKRAIEGLISDPKGGREKTVDLVAMRSSLEKAGLSPEAVEAAIVAAITFTANNVEDQAQKNQSGNKEDTSVAAASADNSKDSQGYQGMDASTESRFGLVGEPITTELFIHPLRKAQEIKPAPLKASQPKQAPQLAICDVPARDQITEGLPKCMSSFKLGYETGLMFAKSLLDQALNVDQSIFSSIVQSPPQQPSRNSTPRRKIGTKSKMLIEDDEPGDSGDEAAPHSKKSKLTRTPYTDEDDEILAQVATRLYRRGMSDNQWFHQIHDECGLNRSFSSIESRMKRFIKKKLPFDK